MTADRPTGPATAPDPRFQIDRRRRWLVSENYIASDGGWATAFREPTDEEWQSIAAAERARILAALPEALETALPNGIGFLYAGPNAPKDPTARKDMAEQIAAALAAAIEKVLK